MKKLKFFILGGMMLFATVSQAQVIEKVNGGFRVLGIPADERTNLYAFERYMSSYEIYQRLVMNDSNTNPEFLAVDVIAYGKTNSKGEFSPFSSKKAQKLAGKDVKRCIKLCGNETLNAYMRWRWLRVQTDLKDKQVQEFELLKVQFKSLEQ